VPPRSKRLSGDAKPGESTLVIRNVTVMDRRTSVRLEPELWDALLDVARRERRTTHEICTLIALHKPNPASLTAAIRVFLLAYFRAAATEDGHERAGHGQGDDAVVAAAFTAVPAQARQCQVALSNS